MYKKIITIGIALWTIENYASDVTSWLEIKPSYFLFSANPMKTIYNHGAFEIQGSGSTPLCRYLNVYGSMGYRIAHGHALESEQETSLTVIPVDIGLKSIINLGHHGYYFIAAGPRYFSFYQYNKSPYVNSLIDDCGIGFFINTGLNIKATESFLIGFFAEYSYEKQQVISNRSDVFSNGNIQIGGIALGLSFDYAF